MDLASYLSERKKLVEQALDNLLTPANVWPASLHQAMRYSMEAGGKRLRPILILAAAEAVGGTLEQALPTACAMEMIHTYSLIHDDLPAMDNDDLRRGRPTNHKVYGEAVAILAGDALLTHAFEMMTRTQKVAAETVLRVIALIASAAGSIGMAGGQVVDLESEHKKISLAALQQIHIHKTGKLIEASVMAGAILGGANDTQVKLLAEYGLKIGLAFQIADDILDIEGGEAIGKDIGSDVAKEKSTYPALMGIPASKELAIKLINEALQCLESFSEAAWPLRAIAKYVIDRKN